jgi:lipopolysaccharide export system permease protein
MVKFGILDRYISREFAATLLGVLGACTIVLLVIKVFEEFDEIIENRTPVMVAVKYFFFVLPFRVLEVVPLATLLAVIFSVGALARNREMLAITASGRSPYRSAVPVFSTALALTGLVVVLNETFVPYCQERVKHYENLIEGRSDLAEARRRNIFDKGVGNTFFTMRSFDAIGKRMHQVTIFEHADDDARIWHYSLRAKSAKLIEENVGQNEDLWEFEDAVEHYYDANGIPTRMAAHTEPIRRPLEADLDQYLASRKEPEQMNLAELSRYIHTLKIRGEDVSVYRTDWYLKLAFPFATVVLAVIGFALAIRAHMASLPLTFGLGIFLSMIFYALAALGQTLGHIGMVPPQLGALGPLVIFTLLGLYLLRRSGFAA